MAGTPCQQGVGRLPYGIHVQVITLTRSLGSASHVGQPYETVPYVDAEHRVALLEGAMATVRKFSPSYDDVLREVSSRINTSGSVGKLDIAALAFWKRVRTSSWAESFLTLAEARIRKVTAPAVVAAREPDIIAACLQARELLRELPGFGTGSAMASVVLTAIRPSGLAVYDRNANDGLKAIELDLADDELHHYAEYMRRIEQCRAEARAVRGHQWSAHEIDLALYVLGQGRKHS
jgi:hypothetical protein